MVRYRVGLWLVRAVLGTARRAPTIALFVLLAVAPALAAPADKPNESKPSASSPSSSQQDEYELLKVLVDTLDQIDRNYVKSIDRRELLEAAIQGMLSRLDPYSTYIAPAETGDFRTNVEKEFGGIGIQLDNDGGDSGPLHVLSPLVGTPAHRAGILAGDRIVAIDDQTTNGMPRDEAVRRLKGVPGTSVTITVIHMDSTERKKSRSNAKSSTSIRSWVTDTEPTMIGISCWTRSAALAISASPPLAVKRPAIYEKPWKN